MPTKTGSKQPSDVPNLLGWSKGHGNRFTHDWFRFPGKFHPPLVEHILRAMKPRAVIDPMAGVGTVAVEAKAAGIPSLSFDIDPVSAFFTKAKTTPISQRTLQEAWKGLAASFDEFRRDEQEISLRKFRDIRIDDMRRHLATVEARSLERLAHWFRRYVMVDYARIDHFIFNGGLPNRSRSVRHFFLACLLSTVRRISLADPTPVSGLEVTSHMLAKIKRGYDIDVFGQFARRVELAIGRMDEYTTYLKENGTYDTPVYTKQADCADLLTLKPVLDLPADLILFSPPYCNAIEYWRRHRLEYFLGRFLDEAGAAQLHGKSVGRTTVGNTRRDILTIGFEPVDAILNGLVKDDRSRKARVLAQYFGDMKHRLEIFYEYLSKDSHCIIVVGDSTTAGNRIPTSKTLCWLGEEVGFEHIRTHRYKIKNRIMQFPLKSNVRIEHESIITLRKR